ncbi:MAG: hypothetical protein ABIP13_00510 [Tepidiformaceae bacterium]
MSNPRTIHLLPQGNGHWEVRLDGGESTLRFNDFGRALDAATAVIDGGETIRVIIHETRAA